MALKHLEELGEQLLARKWAIEVLPGDADFYISAIWKISHPQHPGVSLEIIFDGADDLRTLPLEESCACYVEGHSEQPLYFFSNERLWKSGLLQFLEMLDVIAAGRNEE